MIYAFPVRTPQCCRIGRSALSSRPRAARIHPMPMAITSATTPSIRPGTPLHETARRFSDGCKNMSFILISGVPIYLTCSLMEIHEIFDSGNDGRRGGTGFEE